jgi:hypothetical protein
MMKKLILSFLLLACVAGLFFLQSERKPRGPYTNAQARRDMAEMVPLVEQAAGRHFKKRPRVRVIDTPSSQVAKRLGKTEKDLRHMVGHYHYDTNTIFLIPSNLEDLAKEKHLKLDRIPVKMKLVLVHELTHALEFQYYHAEARPAPLSQTEAADANHSVHEGYAHYIERRVSKRLGLSNISAELDSIGDFKGECLENAGAEFFAWHYKHGGNNRVWKILSAPPTRTSMIFHPETYSPIAKRPVDLHKVLEGMETEFGINGYEVVNKANGEWTIRSYYGSLTPELRRRLFSKPIDGQSLIVNETGSPCLGINIYIISAREAIPDFVYAFEGWIKNTKTTPTAKFKCCGPRKLRGVNADIASRLDMERSGCEWKNGSVIHLSRGQVLVRIVVNDIQVSDERITKIGEKIFQRSPADLQACEKN